MTYYFRTGKTTVYDSVKADVYDEKQQEKFTAFVNKFAGETPEFKLESAYIGFIGAMKADDSTAIDDAWTALLTPEEETTVEEDGLATWAIVLIVVGSVLVVATAVLVPLLIVRSKKKAKQREDEATVNAYKRQKIDTTDDKSIDVYADEESETAEETVENTEETVEETASEEVVETEQTEAEKEE